VFGRKFTLFRLFGFAVNADTSWLFIVALVTWSLAGSLFPERYPGASTQVYWLMGAVGAAGLFLSVVFHELCHSLVARRFGIEMKGITLFIFGGVAEMSEEPPSPRAEFVVAGVGPASSLVLGLVAYLVHRLLGANPGAVGPVLDYLAGINVLLAVFNLVPAFPLDGGRMLRAVLWGRSGNMARATRITGNIGAGFGMVLVIIGLGTFVAGAFVMGVWWVLIGMFLRGAAGEAYRQLVLRRALEGEPVSRFMTEDPVTVDPEAYVRDLVEGYIYRTHHKLYPVVDRGELLGCVTLARVKEVPREKWDWVRVQEIMESCTPANTVAPDADAMVALTRMRRHQVSRLVVVDQGRLVGILSLKDLMTFLSIKVELESG
jgi:Zn-dependent protease/CBS domain-containing protein